MAFLLLLLMLTACAAAPQDLSGQMFAFPQVTSSAHVKLNATIQEFRAVTVCFRVFTDLRRDHGLFSYAIPSVANGFLIFWDNNNNELEVHLNNVNSEFKGLDYKPNMWHSICTTWDSTSGLVQMWFDGLPTMKKYGGTAVISGRPIVVIGQEQDSHGGGFDSKQCFTGMMSDIHMWDHVLSGCEIMRFVNEENFTPGNALNWRSMQYEVVGRIMLEKKETLSCV
ncbi:female protein-like [Genypterus blacodes]|uniref:female protein-like n=1 Tax=Genypterus blacodes TaxID=154954 RepID=UPI003F75AF6F